MSDSLLSPMYEMTSQHPGPLSVLTAVVSVIGWLTGFTTYKRSVEKQFAESRRTIAELRETLIAVLSALESGAGPEQLKIQAALAKKTLSEQRG